MIQFLNRGTHVPMHYRIHLLCIFSFDSVERVNGAVRSCDTAVLTQQGENGYILLIKILVKDPCYERDRKDIQISYPSPTSQYLQFLIR